jgi:Ion channel
MFQRLRGAIRHAAEEENFAAVFGAAITLVVIGTVTYSLAEGWNLADSFYFAVCTLTTSSIADPSLELTSAPIRVFTAFYVLVGIGILVELVRRLGFGFMKMREEQKATREAKRETNGAPESG